MISLILTVCVAAAPTKCHDHELVFAGGPDGPTLRSCMMRSPIEVARYLKDHPDLIVKRWTCRPAGLEEEA